MALRDPTSAAGVSARAQPRQGARAAGSPGQARSAATRARIVDGAIRVLADQGLAGLTHRRIARAAAVPLAATTYHFQDKAEIVAAASRSILERSAAALGGLARSLETADAARADDATGLLIQIMARTAGADRRLAAAWLEIMLAAPRGPAALTGVGREFRAVTRAWRALAGGANPIDSGVLSRSLGDLAIGLALMTLALDLSPRQVESVMRYGADPMAAWRGWEAAEIARAPRRAGRKAAATREAIVEAALQALVSDGPGAVACKPIALKAGLTQAGAFYHFPTTASLIAAAQGRLFAASKARYRAAAGAERDGDGGLERLVERTAAAFAREATAFAPESRASYAVWLEASRQPALRPMVWSAIADQHLAWLRVLSRVSEKVRPREAVFAQALFIGKLIRVLAGGSRRQDLADASADFARDLARLAHTDVCG